jgi:hypothetical protein
MDAAVRDLARLQLVDVLLHAPVSDVLDWLAAGLVCVSGQFIGPLLLFC